MRYIFCGGGTAGHITPAIAIAEKIAERDNNAEILFIGREGGDENRAVRNAGYSLKTLKIKGLQRRVSLEAVRRVFLALKAVKEAKEIISDFKPDVAVGTGGYVSWPVIRAAHKSGIPTAIHESNSVGGLVSRMCAGMCDCVMVNFKGTEACFPKHKSVRTVGNPIRRDFYELTRAEARRRLKLRDNELYILSLGGSGGSLAINSAVTSLMRGHTSKCKGIRHTHVSGEKYYREIIRRYPEFEKGKNGCKITPYLDSIPMHIAASDIIISRCGAMTISEICAVGGAAILIPSPNVTNDHQLKNARLIEEGGGCILIEERELTERALLDAVRRLEHSDALRQKLVMAARDFFVPDSAAVIADAVTELAKAHSASK